MSISTLGTLFQFIGGLGMFLYGMESMADGLQKFAGNRLQRVLEILTSNRLLGVLVGAGVTAIIQSSSATTVGERFARAVQAAIDNQAAFVCFTASGGARMHTPPRRRAARACSHDDAPSL